MTNKNEKAINQMLEAGICETVALIIIGKYESEYALCAMDYSEDDMALACSYDIQDFIESKENQSIDEKQNPVAIIKSRITTWNAGLAETLKIIDLYKAKYADNGIEYTEDDMCLACSYDIAEFIPGTPSETGIDTNQPDIDLAYDDRVEVVPEVQINPVAIIESRITNWNAGLVETIKNLANEAKAITITGHVNGEKEGCKVVRETRLRIRSQRLAIQNKAKSFADIGRNITRTAKDMEEQLIKIIEGEEKRLQREEYAYEARQDQIKREVEELQKQITAARWELMQELEVRPLDYNMCQTATEAIWDEYVAVWKENKERADKQKSMEAESKRIADEKERIEREAREAEEKRIADEAKAKADTERAETEKELAAERAENSKLKAEMDAIKAKQEAERKAKEDAEREARLESEREAKAQAEREQAERDRPDLDKLNAWRLEVERAIHSVKDPEFEGEHVYEAFRYEKKALYMAIPEIFPVVGGSNV